MSGLVDAYDPDVVVGADGRLVERRPGSRHDLHPDLALLLSTSGSTGSPKLVRLSRDNVRSNAHSIAAALGIWSADRAATTLPMHYCYGLSVINSHLVSGAGLVLSDLSVVDDCFWDLFRRAGATTFAGVPYTFDLLESGSFADLDLPTLRYVTQAGGRLAPERVRAYAELGRQRGWDLYVMYGQTEATARMAYLPPDLVEEFPQAIGVAIPGGSLHLDPVDGSAGEDHGELVYRGDNVMMGYARTPADLARGREVTELRTGDLARRLPGGVFVIVGRSSRFAKVFGLRVDLDELEHRLVEAGSAGRCVAWGDRLHVFVTGTARVERVRAVVAERCGVPPHAVRVARLSQLPLTASGKVDYATLGEQAQLLERAPATRRGPLSAHQLRDLYAELLGRPDATLDSTFVGLGGDSLSYVELSVRLADALDTLPREWHTMPVRALAAAPQALPQHSPAGPSPAPQRRGVMIETTVLLRAAAILLIVGTHANLFTIYGGAHLLLGVAGYNFARFQLGVLDRAARLRSGLAALAQIAVPSMIWIAVVAALTGMYQAQTAVFLNGVLGSDSWTMQWQFWFLEALVWTIAGAVLVLACPAIHAVERRHPWGFAVAVLAGALVLRYATVGVEAELLGEYTVPAILWCFALGWAAARAVTVRRRAIIAVVTVAAVAGFFGDHAREGVVAGGLLLLVWLPGMRVPRVAYRAVGALAMASLFIYLTHWQVYPHLEVDHPLLAVLASVAVGLCLERVARPALRSLAARLTNTTAGPATR
jgi:hypothetical protein